MLAPILTLISVVAVLIVGNWDYSFLQKIPVNVHASLDFPGIHQLKAANKHAY